MNGVRYEQGTPAYQSKPRARAASTNCCASIMSLIRGCTAMGEIHGVAQFLEVVDPAPMAVHVDDLDRRAVGDQRIQQRRHIEAVEVVPGAQRGEQRLEPL